MGSFYNYYLPAGNGFPVVFHAPVDEGDFAIRQFTLPLQFVQGFEHHLYMLSFRNKPLFLRFEINIKAVPISAPRAFFRFLKNNPALQADRFLGQFAHKGPFKIVKKI
jgi:hypothetical protein